jgi:predicted DCC family thiol-disulfide oxidoreductase YuxK
VVFFDGVCNLCNASVDWLVRHDRAERLRFASLQGPYGALLLARVAVEMPHLAHVDAMWLLDADGTLHAASDAVLRTAGWLPWPWRATRSLLLVPRVLRDTCYRVVAARRITWFGRRPTCRLPGPGDVARFLDPPGWVPDGPHT